MTNRLLASLVVFTVIATGSPLGAQRLSLAAGITRMPGQLGDVGSDHGAVVRFGVDLMTGSRLTWALEGAVERLNEARSRSTSGCLAFPGGLRPCHFDRRSRDTGWSLGSSLRYTAEGTSVRPYALVGLGVLSVRGAERQVVTDDAGSTLANFSYEGTSSDAALQGHLGAGVNARRAAWPVALYAEARMTRLVHNYSGGLVGNWNPTVVVGVRR